MTTDPNADIEGLNPRFFELGTDEMKAAMMMNADTLSAESDARRFAKGESKGPVEGLARLLDRRFGPPCFWTFGRIACADLGLLDMWINRVLDAKSMKAMFGGLRI